MLVACYFVKDIVKNQRSGIEPRTKFDGVFLGGFVLQLLPKRLVEGNN